MERDLLRDRSFDNNLGPESNFSFLRASSGNLEFSLLLRITLRSLLGDVSVGDAALLLLLRTILRTLSLLLLLGVLGCSSASNLGLSAALLLLLRTILRSLSGEDLLLLGVLGVSSAAWLLLRLRITLRALSSAVVVVLEGGCGDVWLLLLRKTLFVFSGVLRVGSSVREMEAGTQSPLLFRRTRLSRLGLALEGRLSPSSSVMALLRKMLRDFSGVRTEGLLLNNC